MTGNTCPLNKLLKDVFLESEDAVVCCAQRPKHFSQKTIYISLVLSNATVLYSDNLGQSVPHVSAVNTGRGNLTRPALQNTCDLRTEKYINIQYNK